jgi:lipopolysaccharide export system permease protein
LIGAIDRYLIREIALSVFAVLLVLAFISLSNKLGLIFIKIAEGRMSAEYVPVLLGLQLLKIVTVLVPLALVLGSVLGLGRIYRDAEMTAMMACGIGPAQIYKAMFSFGIPLILVLAWFSLYGSPWASRLISELGDRAVRSAALTLSNPGRFRELRRSDPLVAYTEAVDTENQRILNVFLHFKENGKDVVTVATAAEQVIDGDTGSRYLVLIDGVRLDASAGELAARITKFGRFSLLIDEGDPRDAQVDSDEKSFAELWASNRPEDAAELQWRMALPCAALVLLCLTPPLAHSKPRESRFGRIILVALVFFIYANLLAIGKNWVDREVVPLSVGIWWVHLVMLAAGSVLFLGRGPYSLRAARANAAQKANSDAPSRPAGLST